MEYFHWRCRNFMVRFGSSAQNCQNWVDMVFFELVLYIVLMTITVVNGLRGFATILSKNPYSWISRIQNSIHTWYKRSVNFKWHSYFVNHHIWNCDSCYTNRVYKLTQREEEKTTKWWIRKYLIFRESIDIWRIHWVRRILRWTANPNSCVCPPARWTVVNRGSPRWSDMIKDGKPWFTVMAEYGEL